MTLREYSAANAGAQPVRPSLHLQVITDLTHASFRRQGGILFAVVGAKLSEGINFADDMARGWLLSAFHSFDLRSLPYEFQLSSSAVRGGLRRFLYPVLIRTTLQASLTPMPAQPSSRNE